LPKDHEHVMRLPGYIPSRPIMEMRALLGRRRIAFPAPGMFSFARYALVYYLGYLSSIRDKPVARVLLPDYMCHEVATTLRDYGYEPHFYPLEQDFDVSMEALETLLRRPGRWDAMVVGHFHGRMCRNLKDVSALCRERGVAIIEDCVHLPFPHGMPFSATGSDAKLFTLRKVYPVPHGAGIVLREGQGEFARFVTTTFHRRYREGITDLADWAIKQAVKKLLLATGTKYVMQYRDISQDPLRAFNFACPGLDRLLSLDSYDVAVERRRGNYRLYMEHAPVLKEWGEVLRYDLLQDVPHSLVIVLKECFDTLALVKWFMRQGVPAVTGLALDSSVLRTLPAKHRYNQILTLPIHQDLRPAHMAYIIGVLRRHERLAA
jgi:hypothetical protein